MGMSLEAIREITTAEENAKRAQQEAALEARQMIARAREEGERALTQAAEKAKADLSAQKKQAAESARADATALAKTTENRKAAMLVKAEAKRDQAVQLVVEGIVKG